MEKPRITITDQTPLEGVIKYTQEYGLCKSCAKCCSNGTIVLEEDLARLKERLGEEATRFVTTSRELNQIYKKPIYQIRKENGSCVFLEKDPEEGKYSCRVHEVKPVKCSTHLCSDQATILWFEWNYLLNRGNLVQLGDFFRRVKDTGIPFGVSEEYRTLEKRASIF